MKPWLRSSPQIKLRATRSIPAKRSITIRDLLTHTAGVNYGWGLAQREWEESSIIGWYFAGDEEITMRSKVRRMASLPHTAHPGEAFVYGYNTDILGALVEEISGQTLGAFLDENIFSPLGMKDTYFFVPGDKAKQLSTVYALTEDGLQRAPSKDQVETEPNGSSLCFTMGRDTTWRTPYRVIEVIRVVPELCRLPRTMLYFLRCF